MPTKPPRGIRLNLSHPLARGLVFRQLFNERIGTKTFDLSLNGNHGNFAAGAAAPTWKPDGIYFGGNDYINCGMNASLNVTNALTIVVDINTTMDAAAGIVSKSISGAGANYSYLLFKTGGTDVAAFYVTATIDAWDAHIAGSTPIHDGNWHNIIAVYNGTNPLKLYVDGISEGAITGVEPASLRASNRNLLIGIWEGDLPNYLTGAIDNVSIYNRALTSEESTWLYREPYAMFL